MNHRRLITLLLILTCAFPGLSRQSAGAAQKATQYSPVVIPFEMVSRHVMIKVKINNSAPLWFILDSGDKVAIVNLARARSLGLNLHGDVHIGGAGAGTLTGSYVRDASLNVVGLEGNNQSVVMALPLDGLEPWLGHDIDGIIGADFIKQFVVEIDYPARVLRLHDKENFTYTGSGGIIPISFILGGYPVIDGEVSVTGRPAIKGKFVIDIGSGGSLALHRPFVEQEHLPGTDQKTIREIGSGGAGGKVTGRVGRIAGLRIDKFQLENLPTLFSEDKSGALANSEIQGNIGAQILTKFRVILDYVRSRIILEPNASLKDLIAPASSGIRLIAQGSDYRTFRVEELLEDSPAVEAGLKVGDLVLGIDGRAAADLTLWSLSETFEKPGPHKLSVRRGEQTLQITVTSRRLI